MADIFLSYKREDAERAAPLVAVFEACGWSVFWDPHILSGQAWEARLGRELDAARCVVVLWSRRSVGSSWVLREAKAGSERGVLVPVLIERAVQPEEFRAWQAANLVDWMGGATGHAIETLIRGITELIGRPSDWMLWPLDVNLITGDRARYIDLGPTINMGCRLANVAQRPVQLNRIEMVVSRGGDPTYELAWRLLYTTVGLEHLKDPRDERIWIAGTSTWEKGVQLGDTRADISNLWKPAVYECELLGWLNRRPSDGVANLKTRFRAVVNADTVATMTRWHNASAEEWTAEEAAGRASDRAKGFPIRIDNVRAGVQ